MVPRLLDGRTESSNYRKLLQVIIASNGLFVFAATISLVDHRHLYMHFYEFNRRFLIHDILLSAGLRRI